MPIDHFQKSIIAVIQKNRSNQSAVAGGSALHQHGFRLSNDIDIFDTSPKSIQQTALADLTTLEQAGFATTIDANFEGFVRATVAKSDQGATRLEWVRYHAYNYMPFIPDAELGFRLSYVDLAADKLLAAATRREPRDYLDLRMFGRITLPLWNAACAACGKDDAFNPSSLLNAIRRNAHYTNAQLRDGAILPPQFDPIAFGAKVHDQLGRADRALEIIDPHAAGRLTLNDAGKPAIHPKETFSGNFLARPIHHARRLRAISRRADSRRAAAFVLFAA